MRTAKRREPQIGFGIYSGNIVNCVVNFGTIVKCSERIDNKQFTITRIIVNFSERIIGKCSEL